MPLVAVVARLLSAVAGALALLGIAAAAGFAAAPDVIRTGGPSAPADSKVAVVATRAGVAGKAFSVVDARGHVVLRGRLEPARGSALPWRHAATADLSKVARKGTYRVRAAGMTSRTWRVDGRAHGALVRRLLRIFDVNADGSEPNPVFGPAHLHDAIAADGPRAGQRIDLTGGWRDAGDQLKFASTTAFAVSLLEYAARLDPPNAAALRRRADVGVRWLLKAHPAPGEFYVLVGDARDHTTGFRDPATDDANATPGVGIRYAYTSVSTSVLGEVAGALALVAARSEGALKDLLVAAAKDWFAQAVATNRLIVPGGPLVEDFYPDPDIGDDLAFAAAGLYRATGDVAYAAAAGAALAAGSDDQYYSGVTVGTVAPLVAADLCGGFGAPPAADEPARRTGCEGIRKVAGAARERMAETAFATPGIVTFGWVQDNSGAGAVAAAAQRAGVDPAGRKVADAARDYLLGRNPYGASFVVGPASFEAHDPHHPAYLKGSARTLLDGAVVGGIARRDSIEGQHLKLAPGPARRFDSDRVVYEDRRADYVTSEVGLSYSAATILLVAGGAAALAPRSTLAGHATRKGHTARRTAAARRDDGRAPR